jgi:hypothetical protein
MITLMKYNYSRYVWKYNISRAHICMLQYTLVSNMEVGITFNLSNFFPTHYMEAIQIGSYKTKWLSVLFLSAIIFMCDLICSCLILFTEDTNL